MGVKGKMVSSFRLTTDQCSHQWRGTHTGDCFSGCHARCGGWTSHAHGAAECPYIQRAPTIGCALSSMSGTCTTWQGSTCTALKVHKFLRLLGPEDTRTAVGSLPSGWGLLHQTIPQPLQFLASHTKWLLAVYGTVGRGGGVDKFLSTASVHHDFGPELHDVAKQLANSKSKSYIGCHSLTDRCDFTTEKMVGGTCLVLPLPLL